MGPLSVLDDHSRYLVALAATGGTHAERVQPQLEEAFQRCGVPEAMLMDHGTPWWSTHAQFVRTQLSLWLMRQGIRLYWSGIRHPQTQGKVERFHGSLQRAWERRGVPGQNRQAWLDAYRWEHTIYDRTKRSACELQPQCGSPVSIATIPIRPAGNIPLGHGC